MRKCSYVCTCLCTRLRVYVCLFAHVCVLLRLHLRAFAHVFDSKSCSSFSEDLPIPVLVKKSPDCFAPLPEWTRSKCSHQSSDSLNDIRQEYRTMRSLELNSCRQGSNIIISIEILHNKKSLIWFSSHVQLRCLCGHLFEKYFLHHAASDIQDLARTGL